MTPAGLGKSLGAAGAGGLIFTGLGQNSTILVVGVIAVTTVLIMILGTVIVVVLTSALSSDPYRQPNAIATLDRLIYALLGWCRGPGAVPPTPSPTPPPLVRDGACSASDTRA